MKGVVNILLKETPELRKEGGFVKADPELRKTYFGSSLVRMLDARTKDKQSEAAIFTDIDNTFHKAGYEEKMMHLFNEMAKQNTPIIAITGGDFHHVEKRIRAGELPPFTAVAGTVGTDLWVLHEKADGTFEYKRDSFYEKKLQGSGYDRRRLAEELKQFVEEMNRTHPERRAELQNPLAEKAFLAASGKALWQFKIGMDFFALPEEVDDVRKQIEKLFLNSHIVIHEELPHNQHRRTAKDGRRQMYCVNLLPVGKHGSVHYLSKLLGIKEGMVAGDSGNDISMLTESSGLNAVLVGGHTVEAGNHIHKALKGKKNNRRSFQRIIGPDGVERAIYIEPEGSGRQAVESIIRASTILRRIGNIKKMRTENKQKEKGLALP